MATLADLVETQRPPGLTALIDRWIYVFMAALFFVTVLVGFIPDSIGKVAAIQAGQRPPFPLALHVHAVLMGSWISLLLVQTSLMATGRSGLHRQLGALAAVLAPAMVVTGIVLVPTMYMMTWHGLQAGLPPAAEAGLKQTFAFQTNIILFQIRSGILFPILIALALAARGKDSSMHKRLMILATVVPLPAAIDRIHWIPSTLPASPMSIDVTLLLWIAPMFLWDLYRLGRVHRAYLIWFGLNLPFVVIANALWGTKWWSETVQHVMGVA